MTRDEIAAEETAIRALIDEATRRRVALINSKVASGNAEFSERGISIGSKVTVIEPAFRSGDIHASERRTTAVFLGYESNGYRAVPGIYAITKSGKSAARRMSPSYGAKIIPAEQNGTGS